MKRERTHRKLNAELIERMAKLRKIGFTHKNIAETCGISHEVLSRWLSNGKSDRATALESQLSQAMQEACYAGAQELAQRIFDGDTRDAQWLLTHSPVWRDTWSDAAATRREVTKALTAVVQVIQASDLTPEQQERLLLRMSAAGIGAGS